MGCHIFSTLLLLMTVESASMNNGFFISAPTVFHVGVNEKVLVQMPHPFSPVTLYLVHGSSNTLMSARKTIQCTERDRIQTVELMIERENMSRFPSNTPIHYLKLMAESPSFSGVKSTMVTVSKHRGNIFIQTDQPIYNPTQRVKYRIFTLDHTFRPHMEVIKISVFNAAGNRVMKSLKTAKGGIFKHSFSIPDVAKMGTWKITAHYEDDEANAASIEFKVQQFVLPSFEVNLQMDQKYVLLTAEHFDFTISARYSHGEKVKGAYHCQFGLLKKDKVTTSGLNVKPGVIRGLELTGSVKDGTAAASLQIDHLQKQLNQSLSEIQQSGAQLYLGVFVTNIQSGEIQEAEVYLPIISHKYTLDFTRTRSYFIPGYPLDVVVVVRLPDGSPAAGVAIKIDVPESTDKSLQGTTDQEGAVFIPFNIPDAPQITVEASVGDLKQRKVIQPASSPSNSYLFLNINNRMYSVGESLTVNYHTNGQGQGFIYYMVLSRGILITKGSIGFGTHVRGNLQITSDMVPSFRLIGYYHNQQGDIIADSVWLDVRDECEIKVKVEHKGRFSPGEPARLEFDLHGQNAKVALLAVDKAIYALNADNKLRAKQVFSTMQSYDLGCSYSGGANPTSVLTDAGLSFVSQSMADWKKIFGCDSESVRQRRDVDLQQEMMTLKSNISDENLQECCIRGFSLIPMIRTCQERAKRVSLVEPNPDCADVFLTCCLEGERLRQKKIQEDARKGLGRTEITDEFEEFLLASNQYIRRIFSPSFAFTEFDVKGKGSFSLALPDSITTWDVQVITLSETTGFCVVKPTDVRAFKEVFVSLRLPYSARKYEQLSISPVIYNYGDDRLEVAVHMAQTKGLCSPGSATSISFVNITLEPQSSQFVSFSAVPMESGSIPIKIRLYDIENERGIDAIEKTLNVLSEGLVVRDEATMVYKLDGRSLNNIIDGFFPDDTVPDSSSNIFISVEGDGFGSSHAKNLLSPQKVASLIVLPDGCLEQTTTTLIPTVSALRYLDLSDQWFDLPAGTRDDTLDKLEKGYMRILDFKDKGKGYYRPLPSTAPSNWVTALIVKVLSLVAERQTVAFGEQGRRAWVVDLEEIRHPVQYLLSVQNTDGSYNDPNRVLRRRVLTGKDQEASMTAFITLALRRSLQFLDGGLKNNAEAGISRSTTFLLSHLKKLQHPYAVAITAYCLAVCLPKETNHSSAWTKLQGMAIEGKNGCYLWSTNPSAGNQANADATTVESTAYALLAAVELGQMSWAEKTACWLTTQENYDGGFKSTQDTMVALEALAEYELRRPTHPTTNLRAEFTVSGRNDIVTLEWQNKKEKVETDLKKFTGNNILVQLTGQGETKLKVVKAYHLLAPKDACDKVSINVTVTGKVKYTAKVIDNYDYYENYENNEEVVEEDVRVPRSAIEWFDARTRDRRDVDNNLNSLGTVTYRICVSHSLNINLTGMAIADITLLSGFEAVTTDLDRLKDTPERYISHYEVSYGRVLLYFNELFDSEECVSFDARQRVLIGLLQPAAAVFYDYYEPQTKCTVFYSAPQRSKMVSKLCSGDVCQCAERPCHTIQDTQKVKRDQRIGHACFSPTVDYAYIVEVFDVSTKSNFELYRMTIKDVLRTHGDDLVKENSVRVFAKRIHCKGQLELGKQYLIMGKDGSTTDSSGEMQYLLESNTWVERKPLEKECQSTAYRNTCRWFNEFTDTYKINGCTQ